MSYHSVAEFNDQQRLLTETLSPDAAKAWRLRHIQLWEVKLVKTIAAKAVGFVSKVLSPNNPPAPPHREQLSFH